MTHHSRATDFATGPAGDNVERSPEHPVRSNDAINSGNSFDRSQIVLREVDR